MFLSLLRSLRLFAASLAISSGRSATSGRLSRVEYQRELTFAATQSQPPPSVGALFFRGPDQRQRRLRFLNPALGTTESAAAGGGVVEGRPTAAGCPAGEGFHERG